MIEVRSFHLYKLQQMLSVTKILRDKNVIQKYTMCVGICAFVCIAQLYMLDKGENTYACCYSSVNFDNWYLLTTV